MTLFFMFLGVKVAKSITKKFVEPHGDEDIWSEVTAKDYEEMPKHNMYWQKH